MSSFIVVKDLWKVYSLDGAPTAALRGVSFEVERGEFVAVVGPSGSGKSTLLHLIGGLDRPTRGCIRVAGREISGITSDEELSEYRNRVVGFVFQMFYLIPRFTALQNVELPLIARGVPAEERRKRALEALRLVGLEGKAGNKPSQLSGGEQQRVAVARAIVGRPQILLADEPTGNLDSNSARSLMEVFRRLNGDLGMTIVLVTHNLGLIWYCDRVIRLADGRIIRTYLPDQYENLLKSFVVR